MKKTDNTQKRKCSLFEEMLMWTSYRYCIGRHTYVTTMAYDIGKNYFSKLTPDRREFTAKDIYNELETQLSFKPFGFGYDGIYGNERNPLADFIHFLNEYAVTSADELMKYRCIHLVRDYNHNNELRWEASVAEPVINRHWSSSFDIDDLIPWSDLAEYFNESAHQKILVKDSSSPYGEREIECYRSFVRKCEPVEGQTDHYRSLPFGWDEVWKPCEKFGEHAPYILETDSNFIKYVN